MELITPIIAIAILIHSLIQYKKYSKTKLDNNIKELKQLEESLQTEINIKQNQIDNIENNIDSYKLDEINRKMDYIIDDINKKNQILSNTPIIIITIVISTIIILYYIHKWTYYIQPENQMQLYNKLLNEISKFIN